MLIRNLNQIAGLCNSTRLMITHLRKWFISADIISDKNIGTRFNITRIIMSPNESKWSFNLDRRQPPLATFYAMTINKNQGQTLQRL